MCLITCVKNVGVTTKGLAIKYIVPKQEWAKQKFSKTLWIH